MKKINKVVLYDVDDDINSTIEWVNISEDGNLILQADDCGQTPLKFWGDIDYEYWRFVDKDWKDTVLLLLMKDRFKRFSDLENWIIEKKVPNTFGSYI